MWPLPTDWCWVYPSRWYICPEGTVNTSAKFKQKNDGVLREKVAYAGEMGDDPTGGKSSKLLRFSCPADEGETCSLILL